MPLIVRATLRDGRNQMSRKRKHAEREKWLLELAKREGRLAHGMVIPEGVIAADLSAQAKNNSYGPPLYYLDQPFTCVDCGAEEVWTAEQQKWYFEVAKRPMRLWDAGGVGRADDGHVVVVDDAVEVSVAGARESHQRRRVVDRLPAEVGIRT